MIGVAEIRAHLSETVRGLEPEAVSLPEAVPQWEHYDAIEKLAAAARTLLARRVEESRAWARAGHRSAAEFLAERSGSSVGAARTQLEMSEKLERLPAVERAVRDGEFSGAKAALLVEGASANPAATERLLDQATRGSLKELRDEVLRVRAAADPSPDATQRRIHGEAPLPHPGVTAKGHGTRACTAPSPTAPISKAHSDL